MKKLIMILVALAVPLGAAEARSKHHSSHKRHTSYHKRVSKTKETGKPEIPKVYAELTPDNIREWALAKIQK